MGRDALIFGISGAFFGLIVGWILGTQNAGPAGAQPAPASVTAPGGPETSGAAAPIDLRRVAALEQQAGARPNDAAVRVELGNLYYDAERYDLAIPWYEAALQLNPRDVNVSTDLAVGYYYASRVDQALAQIDRSLAIEPDHVKTLFNQGIIRAFGKEDLAGATASWERVVQIAPDSQEGRDAKRMLDGLQRASGAHPGGPPDGGSSSPGLESR